MFDSLNSVDNMRVAMDAVRESRRLVRRHPVLHRRPVRCPRAPSSTWTTICAWRASWKRPAPTSSASKTWPACAGRKPSAPWSDALKQETGLPIHFHTHDTSGIAAASVLAAIDAGVDAVDGAMDAMSGLTSQPNLGAIVAALKGSERDPGLSQSALSSHRPTTGKACAAYYAPFEADMRAGTSSVYLHEMPGGQYTNLREQARSLGLDHHWAEICQCYAEVNQLFGDIVKVTPTSKVVGDMALFMVANGLSDRRHPRPGTRNRFPAIGGATVPGRAGHAARRLPGWRCKERFWARAHPLPGAPGRAAAAGRSWMRRAQKLEKQIARKASDQDLASYLMYPDVFRQFAEHESHYGDVSHLPTPAFFYGLQEHVELAVTLEPGKTKLFKLQGQTELPEEGCVKLFFEVNGQPRVLRVPLAGAKPSTSHPKAEIGNPAHVGAAMPGMVAMLAVKAGTKSQKRRCAAVDRGDEDGNRDSRRERWHGNGCLREARERRSTRMTLLILA